MLLRPRRWHAPCAVAMGGSRPGWRASRRAGGNGLSTLNLLTFFGGSKRQVNSQDFRGGDVTAVFGGYELDLRMAAIAVDQAVIEATGIFGGIQIDRARRTWTVEARGVGIFGGFVDDTQPPRPRRARGRSG